MSGAMAVLEQIGVHAGTPTTVGGCSCSRANPRGISITGYRSADVAGRQPESALNVSLFFKQGPRKPWFRAHVGDGFRVHPPAVRQLGQPPATERDNRQCCA
jgi:hypothetical protein